MNYLKNGTIAVGAPGSEMRLKAEAEDAAKQCVACHKVGPTRVGGTCSRACEIDMRDRESRIAQMEVPHPPTDPAEFDEWVKTLPVCTAEVLDVGNIKVKGSK